MLQRIRTIRIALVFILLARQICLQDINTTTTVVLKAKAWK
jgi:hypothetical protein